MSATQDPEDGRAPRDGVATIVQVAQDAGVSIATVSRALNKPHLLREETRLRVERSIGRLDYRPNRVALSLRTGVSGTVGLLVGDVSQPWYAKLTKALDDELDRSGFVPFLYDLAHCKAKLLRFLVNCTEQGVQGIILSTGDRLDEPELVEAIRRTFARVPIVLAGSHVPDVPVPRVTFDDRDGGRLGAKHLLQVGATPAAYLGHMPDSFMGQERLRGFAETLEAAGQAVDPWIWVTEGLDYANGYATTRNALASERVPRGILGANDQLAIGAMRAIREAGLRIPDDIAVVGFGDLDVGPYIEPPLSSVAGSVTEIARLCCDALIAMLNGQTQARSQLVPRSLVVRESSMPGPANAAAPDRQGDT